LVSLSFVFVVLCLISVYDDRVLTWEQNTANRSMKDHLD